MIMKNILCFTIVIFFFISNSLSKVNATKMSCTKAFRLKVHPDDCKLYYFCNGNLEYTQKRCKDTLYFHPKLKICMPGSYISDDYMKECSEKDSSNDNTFAKIPTNSGKVSWKMDNKNDMPEEITLTLTTKKKSISHQKSYSTPLQTFTTLKLKKQVYVSHNIKVITSKRGRSSEMKTENEKWELYYDVETKASMSVAIQEEKSGNQVVYDGTFEAEGIMYRLSRLQSKQMIPILTNTSSRVLINGTSYLLSEEQKDREKTSYDVERREERLVSDETTASTMSHLERIINNQAQTQALTSQHNYGVELMVVIDFSIFFKWYAQSSKTSEHEKTLDAIQNIKYYYTHIINGINERYKTINEPDMKFYVKCVGYFIAQAQSDSPFTEERGIKYDQDTINVHIALDAFTVWVNKTYSSEMIPNFDSAALFTAYKMRDRGRYITGLAEIGQTCYLKAVSITKDQLEYATIQTGAHEIGHNLGAQHDGYTTVIRSNDDIGHRCDSSSQFVMAQAPGVLTNKTFFNPYKFSSCSVSYFRKYIAQLDRLNNNCLKNVAYDHDQSLTSFFLQSYPGQKYSVDMQCKLLYGPLSYYCAGGGERNDKICRELVCYNPEKDQCESKVEFRAVQGTHCGNKKWCMKSTCVYDQRAPEANEGNCIYGDFKGVFQVAQRRNTCEMHIRENPKLCYNKHYREMCCDSCSEIENKAFVGCEYGDKTKYCSLIQNSECYDNSKQEECCSTCKQREAKNSIANCRYGDKASWCNTFNSQSANQCYISNDFCCQTCAGLQTTVTGCKYGDKIGGCTSDHCASSAHKADCCYTCRSYIPPVTTTTTTARPIFPKECPRGDIVGWCGTLHPGQCYGSNDVCCQTCLQYFDANKPEGCKYGDQSSWCSSYVKSAQECRSEHVAKSCCHSCLQYVTPNSSPSTCIAGNDGQFCPTIPSYNCYQYKETCCETCRQYFDGVKNCEYGDKVPWCSSYIQDKSYCDVHDVGDLCCRTCAELKSKESFDEPDVLVDKADWCKNNMWTGYCYQPSTEETCAATCDKHRNDAKPNCKYGDFYSWCDKKYCSVNKKECCASCA